jgi:hypothetical protein
MSTVWIIIRPGYGEHTGTPEEIWGSRAAARRRLRELNEPWAYLGRQHRMPPYRLQRMEVRT